MLWLVVWVVTCGLWTLVVKLDTFDKICHGRLKYTRTCIGYNIQKKIEGSR